ncbi:MAG: glycosyltransferase [Rhodospirillales bacterium 69-11]|nr:glycosyltransferase [Rhodospirillales bacterium]OJW20620.1 MAG: glycosyltransferase [Rhodospirillales bacterium 69-11]
MKIVIFGLAVSSSWGNGHAALWRGLIRALHADGHHVTFFERDVPYYAEHRDLTALPGGGALVLYREWDAVRAQHEADEADVVMVTSYCPDASAATTVALHSRAGLRCFYDLDTPVTLARLDAGETVDYVPPDGFDQFDLVLSYTGGATLETLRTRLGARHVVPIYGSVDPDLYRPGTTQPQYRASLSYIGTYAADRQPALERLFIHPARERPEQRFVIAGAMYPKDFPWTDNVFFVRHLPPGEHADFYASSRLTLNVTRKAMAEAGWCPSGRLFEAAASGAPILTDRWPGLAAFFEPGDEILVADDTQDTLDALARPQSDLDAIARRARERTLDEHTAQRRARQMVAAFEAAVASEVS